MELSNLQRQILFETADIGRLKVEAARDRLHEINPDVEVTIYPFDLVAPSPRPSPSREREFAESASTPSLSREGGAGPKGRVRGTDIDSIISAYNFVADGCDNFATRFTIADACERLQKPLVSAAVSGFLGQLSTFKPYLGAPHPSYRDLVPELPPEAATCTETGVIGAVCGILGSMQALEVIKEILGAGESLSGTLIRYDGLRQEMVRTRLPRGRR